MDVWCRPCADVVSFRLLSYALLSLLSWDRRFEEEVDAI